MGEPIAEDEAQHGSPTVGWRQLLRSFSDALQELADRAERPPDFSGVCVQAGDGQRGLIRMLGLPCHSVQEQGTTRGGFGVAVRNGQSCIQTPPVVDQTDDARHDLAALPIVVFFLLFQKYFLEGVRLGAVKG